MDTFLDNDDDEYYDEEVGDFIRIIEPKNYKVENLSIWLKDKNNNYIPSTDMKVLKKLEPNIYTVDVNRDVGYFCQKTSFVSDELFLFSDSIVEHLINEVDSFWSKKEIYKENNITHKRGILLEGPPGTGKTSLISLLTERIVSNGGVVFKVSGPSNLSVYISFLKNFMRLIEPETQVITILEDLEKYREHEDLLDFLDGKTSVDHHIIVATTNNSKKIPDNFLRPSRIDLRIEIGLPSKEVRKEFLLKKGFEEGNDLDKLVEETKELSLADLKEIYTCVKLLGYPMDTSIAKLKNPRQKKDYLVKQNRSISL